MPLSTRLIVSVPLVVVGLMLGHAINQPVEATPSIPSVIPKPIAPLPEMKPLRPDTETVPAYPPIRTPDPIVKESEPVLYLWVCDGCQYCGLPKGVRGGPTGAEAVMWKLRDEGMNVKRVKFEDAWNRQTASEWGVTQFPTWTVNVNGRPGARAVGNVPIEQVRWLLNNHPECATPCKPGDPCCPKSVLPSVWPKG